MSHRSLLAFALVLTLTSPALAESFLAPTLADQSLAKNHLSGTVISYSYGRDSRTAQITKPSPGGRAAGGAAIGWWALGPLGAVAGAAIGARSAKPDTLFDATPEFLSISVQAKGDTITLAIYDCSDPKSGRVFLADLEDYGEGLERYARPRAISLAVIAQHLAAKPHARIDVPIPSSAVRPVMSLTSRCLFLDGEAIPNLSPLPQRR